MENIKEVLKNLNLPTNSSTERNNSSLPIQNEQYSCVICKDARFVHPGTSDGKIDYSRVVPCLCTREQLERKKTAYLLSWCELPPEANHMTFESFRSSAELLEAYKAVRSIVNGSLKWVTLIGKVDHCKTHLAVSACHEWLKNGKPARYAYVPLLLDELRRGFGVDAKENYERRFNGFLNVPLLVLDDLGTENSTPWVQEKLDTIIDYRLMHQLPLIVTTNLSLDKLPERIASRLLRNGKVVVIK